MQGGFFITQTAAPYKPKFKQAGGQCKAQMNLKQLRQYMKGNGINNRI